MPKFDTVDLHGPIYNANLRKRYVRISALEFQVSPAATDFPILGSSRSVTSIVSGDSATILTSFRIPAGSIIDNIYVFRSSTGAAAEAAKDTLSLFNVGFAAGSPDNVVLATEALDHTSNAVEVNAVAIAHTDVQAQDVPILNDHHWYVVSYQWMHNATTDSQTGAIWGVIVEYTPFELIEPT